MDKFNFDKFKPFIDTSVFIYWASKLNKPVNIVKTFSIIVILTLIVLYFTKSYFNFVILFGAIYAFFVVNKGFSKNDQIVVLFSIWTFIKVVLCSFIGILCFSRYFNEGLTIFIYPALLSLTWLPSIEFIKLIGKRRFLLFGVRMLISVYLIYLWMANNSQSNILETIFV